MIAVPRMMRFWVAAFLIIASSIVTFAQTHDPLAEPLSFQPNLGQEAARVRFASTGAGYRLLITDQDATLSLQKPGDKLRSNVRMTLINGQPATEAFGS